jgi:epoxyqueuosine reductase
MSEAETLVAEIGRSGSRAALVPAARIGELRAEIEDMRSGGGFNGYQQFIARDIYRYGPEDPAFSFGSVAIIASPVPPYADVCFNWKGERVMAKSMAIAFTGRPDAAQGARDRLESFFSERGRRAEAAPRLPLKRLAARSGLARYGRNNIAYAEGMGSFFSLSAYFTDLDAEGGTWKAPEPMAACASCSACLEACPTGAIREDRFLLDNERCLSCFNEGPGDFPEWLPADVHHTLYDCLKCQLACPADRPFLANKAGPFEFSEAETEALLSGKGIEGFGPESMANAMLMSFHLYLEAIPRNLRVLVENHFAKRGKEAVHG